MSVFVVYGQYERVIICIQKEYIGTPVQCTGTPLPFSHLLKIDSTVKKPPEGFTNYRLFNIVLLSIITSALYNMYVL